MLKMNLILINLIIKIFCFGGNYFILKISGWTVVKGTLTWFTYLTMCPPTSFLFSKFFHKEPRKSGKESGPTLSHSPISQSCRVSCDSCDVGVGLSIFSRYHFYLGVSCILISDPTGPLVSFTEPLSLSNVRPTFLLSRVCTKSSDSLTDISTL